MATLERGQWRSFLQPNSIPSSPQAPARVFAATNRSILRQMAPTSQTDPSAKPLIDPLSNSHTNLTSTCAPSGRPAQEASMGVELAARKADPREPQRRRRKRAAQTNQTPTLRSKLLGRLQLPEEVRLFGQLEELCRLYSFELPNASRTQMELVFDVYDGRKCSLSGTDDDNEEHENEIGQPEEETATGCGANSNEEAGAKRPSGAKPADFSWSRLLWGAKESGGLQQLGCCLRKSDTGQEFGAGFSQASSSVGRLGSSEALAAGLAGEQELGLALALDSGLEPVEGEADEEGEEAELRAEALQLIAPLLSRPRRSSSLSENAKLEQSIHSGLERQVLLDSSPLAGVSICLFNKRARRLGLKREAENGRRWAQLEWRLEELSQRLEGSGGRGGRLWRERAGGLLARELGPGLLLAEPASSKGERLSEQRRELLLGLVKDSLNHLIDAQLLLRNKLNAEHQQQQQQTRPGNEYESLLRNNFNLLKIWQNLEESKRLACFVCEPIKANLADLFWFSRRRFGLCRGQSECLLASPLVCLDAVQVKRGLLQVSVGLVELS